jgi:hypothetical protein
LCWRRQQPPLGCGELQRQTPAIPKFTRHGAISQNLVGFHAYQAVPLPLSMGSRASAVVAAAKNNSLPPVCHLIVTWDGTQHPRIKSASSTNFGLFSRQNHDLKSDHPRCPCLASLAAHLQISHAHHCFELGWRQCLASMACGAASHVSRSC